MTIDIATVSNPAALSSTAAVSMKGGSGNDTFNTIVQTATATTGTLANYSKSLYSLDAGSGTDTLQLSNIAATAGVAGAFVVSTSGVASGTGTANSSILGAINSFAGLETLQIIQRDTQTTAATTAQAQGAISVDVAAVTSVKDFAISTSVVTAAGTGGSHVITGAGATATAAAGNAVTFTSLANDNSISVTGRVTGGAGLTSSTANGGAAADALSLTPLVNNGSNALTVTLKGSTITGGAGGASTATNGSGGAGADAIDFGSMEQITLVSSGTATNATGSYSNTLAGGAGGAKTATGTGSDGAAGFGVNMGTSTKLVVTGTKNIDLGTVSGTTYTVDASGLSGDLKITQSDTSNDTIIGGSGANSVTIKGGQFTLDLSASSAKVDTIDLSGYAVGGTSVATTIGTIKGVSFVSVLGDKIDVAGTAANPTAAATGSYTNTSSGAVLNSTIDTFGKVGVSVVTGTATLTDYINAAFKVVGDTSGSVGIVEYAGSTYLVEELGSSAGNFDAGTDLVVKLDGLVGLTGITTTAGATGFLYVV